MTLGTKEWAEVNRNCIEGCSNDCRYCYAKKMAIRFKRRTKENWHYMVPNSAAYQATRKVKGRVMFPTSHDLHIEHVDWWFPFLKSLLENGNEVLIVSKPQFAAIQKIADKLYDYVDQMEFRFTIGTNNEETRQFWEPHAPSIGGRIKCLNYVYEAGYKNSVSMEPLLMHNPAPMIKTLERRVTGEIWIGLMNYLRISDFTPDELIWYNQQNSINSKTNIQEIYELLKDNPKIRWKDSVRDLLELP